MKKFGSITAIAIFIASLMSANAMADHRKGRIAAGLTLGLFGTAIVASELAREHKYHRHHRYHKRAHTRTHRHHNRYHRRAHKIEYKQNRKYHSRAHQRHRHGYNSRRKPFKQVYRELYGEQHQHPHRNMMRHYQHHHTEELNSEHVEWCNKTYDSYEQDTNTFKTIKAKNESVIHLTLSSYPCQLERCP